MVDGWEGGRFSSCDVVYRMKNTTTGRTLVILMLRPHVRRSRVLGLIVCFASM